MTRTIIHIDIDALDERLQGGELWTDGWGDWESPDGKTCLHGAIRYCQPVPGDAHLIERVGERFGFGTGDNDDHSSWAEVRGLIRPDITDEMLAVTFGPQWEPIVALVRRAATLTPNEAGRLSAAWAAAGVAAWDAAWAAAGAAARAAAMDTAGVAAGAAARITDRFAAQAAARVAVGDAAAALAVRDLIGQHGFTQEHYDTLTRPWATVIGPVHPGDAPVASPQETEGS